LPLKTLLRLPYRTLGNRNVFYDSEQARGALALAMLSQQLEDVNLGWNPEWCS
jgi:hypothetical protein